MAVLDMCDKVTKSIDNGQFTIGAFIDLSKAFNTINYEILLQKLNHIDIRSIPLAWFKSYLYHKAQVFITIIHHTKL